MNKDLKLILGAMNFGPQVKQEDSQKMVEMFLRSENIEIDTAYVYNNGETDLILGNIFKNINRNQFSISTKIHPRITGKLDANAVYTQFFESLIRLKVDYVDILYFHFPDANTPIDGALEAMNELYLKGKIKEFGLSNFPAWMVVDIWHICKSNGWICPTVYQGRYNGLSRNVEKELFPALRKLGISFYAYNPLAGGMLTGKHHTFEEVPQQGRFARLQSYRKRYWKKSYFDAVNILTHVCKNNNIGPAEAAYRWLAYHSLLNKQFNDGIIVGASSIYQLDQNMGSINKGNLPLEVVDAFDEAWEEAKTDSPEYYNFFYLNR